MSVAAELLDKYKQTRSIPTDMALADDLGKTRALISAWRAGKAQPQTAEVERMCKATGEDEGVWLTLLAAEREPSPAARSSLLRLVDIAKKYGHAACIAVMAGAAAILTLRHGVDAHGVAAFALSPVYIMRNQGCFVATGSGCFRPWLARFPMCKECPNAAPPPTPELGL